MFVNPDVICEVEVLLQDADRCLASSSKSIVDAMVQHHPHTKHNALLTLTSLDLFNQFQLIRAAKKSVKKAEASITRARALFPDLPACQVANIETLSFTKMMYSTDHRVDQVQHEKLAESLLSVKTMHREVKNHLALLGRTKAQHRDRRETELAAAA